MNPELRYLLTGYATGTLTDAERERLFAAALDDQALFDALAEEQSLKDLLDDPEARGYLLAELDRLPPAEQSGNLTPELVPAPRLMSAGRARSVPVAPQAAPPKSRFWLPFAAVMVALVITGIVWWRTQPALVEVAMQRPSVPAAEPVPASPEPEKRAANQVQPITRRVESAAPVPGPPVPSAIIDSAVKKELDQAAPTGKKGTEKKVAEKSANPAPVPAAEAAAPARQEARQGTLASAARPVYQWLRLENGQYLPAPTDAHFQAGDMVVLRVPYEETMPLVTQGNGKALALNRDGNWYRSEPITLTTGQQEFIVTPDVPLGRSRFAAADESESKKLAPREALRIRLNVP